MPETVDLFVPLDELDEPLGPRLERALGWARGQAGALRVRAAIAGRAQGAAARPSPARAGRAPGRGAGAAHRAAPRRAGRPAAPAPRVVVVGSGPAGSWAALRLAEAGVPVDDRRAGQAGAAAPPRPRADHARPARADSSNYCFGEGGAGTYSDGKLYTRAKDREGVADVLADLVRFGAPDEIAVESRPHVGLEPAAARAGGAARRTSSASASTTASRRPSRACASRAGACARCASAGGDELPADVVVLAVGHSARAVYAWAAADGIALERKAIAIGVRIEHPQRLIDEIQYGDAAGHPKLPPAFYELTSGGRRSRRLQLLHVPGRLDRPGRDRARRRRRQRHEPVAPRLAVRERRAGRRGRRGRLRAGGGRPAGRRRAAAPDRAGGVSRGRRRVSARRPSGSATSWPGAPAPRSARRATGRGSRRPTSTQVLPDFVAAGAARGPAPHGRAAAGLPARRRACWSPPRRAPARRCACCATPTTLQSPSLAGLYPCGEGAGYAGGIVSAALDGARVARARRWRRRDGGVAAVGQAARPPISRSTWRSQAALLFGDHLEADAGRVGVALARPRPGDARLHPQRRRVGLDVVENQEQADRDLLALVERPVAVEAGAPSTDRAWSR